MIKIRKKDTIVDIVEKINNSNSEEIILDFPLGHPILHNYLSLKIIKNKSGKKKLIILTSDLTSRKIGKNLGIKYSIIKDKKFIEESDKNSNLLKYNFTFYEYLVFEIKNFIKNIKNSLARNKNINSINKYYSKYNKNSNIAWFLGGLLISIFLLVFIFYFAVNKTYVYITPEVIVKSRARNFVFKQQTEDISIENSISYINKISETISLTRKFTTTGIDLGSIKKSRGTAELINETKQEQHLLADTKVQNDEGIIYKIPKWTTIPPAIEDNFGNIIPGTIETEIISEIHDVNGKFIGSRGNIEKDVKLIIPGLESEQDKIYLKTTSKIKGGKDKHNRILSETDLENAKKILEEKLKSNVIKDLTKRVKEENSINKTNTEIFGIDNMIEYSDSRIEILGSTLTGSQVDTFSLKGSIRANTYTYDKDLVINKIKNVIRDSILKGTERIISIDNKSLRISNVIYKKDEPLEIKATAEIEVLVSHDFLNQNNNYVEKLKNTIKGMDQKEAKKILINDTKISNVEIKIRPFFMRKVSNINDNIIFKVLD